MPCNEVSLIDLEDNLKNAKSFKKYRKLVEDFIDREFDEISLDL